MYLISSLLKTLLYSRLTIFKTVFNLNILFTETIPHFHKIHL